MNTKMNSYGKNQDDLLNAAEIRHSHVRRMIKLLCDERLTYMTWFTFEQDKEKRAAYMQCIDDINSIIQRYSHI